MYALCAGQMVFFWLSMAEQCWQLCTIKGSEPCTRTSILACQRTVCRHAWPCNACHVLMGLSELVFKVVAFVLPVVLQIFIFPAHHANVDRSNM